MPPQVAHKVLATPPTSRRETVFGLDLGKIKDHAALVCTEDLFAETPTNGGAWQAMRRVVCLASKRWALGTGYIQVIRELKAILERDCWLNPVVVVDATGVGQPVIEVMRQEGLRCRIVPVTISGGNSQRIDASGCWWVAKSVLVSNAQIMLQSGELLVAAKEKALFQELSNYVASSTGSGNEVYSAPPGEHDDLVIGLCLAAWYTTRARRRIKTVIR